MHWAADNQDFSDLAVDHDVFDAFKFSSSGYRQMASFCPIGFRSRRVEPDQISLPRGWGQKLATSRGSGG
jgi:hypothetical protein